MAPGLAEARIESFEAFWPYYLREHAHPVNRALHVAGTGAALATLAAAAFNPLLLPCVPVVGYAAAWVGHYLVEKNRPATFTYPLWSLRGDLRMFRLAVTGRLGPQLDRALSEA